MHLAFTAQTTAYHTLTEKQAFFSSLLGRVRWWTSEGEFRQIDPRLTSLAN
jgi:hypothetical protein